MPNEPERGPLNEYVIPDSRLTGGALHEPPAPWTPNEPEIRVLSDDVMTPQPQHGGALHEEAASWLPNEPEPGSAPAAAAQRSTMPQ
jgi:hypothetical protein